MAGGTPGADVAVKAKEGGTKKEEGGAKKKEKPHTKVGLSLLTIHPLPVHTPFKRRTRSGTHIMDLPHPADSAANTQPAFECRRLR